MLHAFQELETKIPAAEWALLHKMAEGYAHGGTFASTITGAGRKRRTGWSKVYTDEPSAGDNYSGCKRLQGGRLWWWL